jgi:hypothetical protein
MGWFGRPVRMTATLVAALSVMLAVASSSHIVKQTRAVPELALSRTHRAAASPSGRPMPVTTPNVAQAAGGVPAPRPVDGSILPKPLWIYIASIDVSAALSTVGLNGDRTIQVPTDWNQPAWYTGSPTPGAVGPAVIVGHLDSYVAPAVFWNLHLLQRGAQIVITRSGGTRITFTVTMVIDYQQSAFPTQAVYGQTIDPELRLITCGGTYDIARGHYSENTVVFATLTTAGGETASAGG